MDILIVGDYSPGTCAWYYHHHLVKLGHKIEIFDYRKSFLPFKSKSLPNRAIRHMFKRPYNKLMNIHLLNYVKKLNPDMVFVVKGETLFPDTIKAIQRRCRIVNWFVDPIVSFNDPNVMATVSKYDLFFAKDPAVVNVLRLAGHNNLRYLPEGYDSECYKKVKSQKNYSADVSLMGYQYDYRMMFTSNLSEFDLKLWGKIVGDKTLFPDIDRYAVNRYMSVEEKNIIFNSTKINLNIHHAGEVNSANVRLFEICGSGGFQIVDYKPCLEEFFKIGKEIVCYKDMDDLKKKIKYYLAHEKERKNIAEAGHRRAINDHKIQDRLKQLMVQADKLKN